MVLEGCIIQNNCRLCHSNPGQYNFHTDQKFMKEVYECIKIKVNDESKELLPQCVCIQCKQTIKDFLLYKKNMQKVDKQLRNILTNMECKTEMQFQEQNFYCLNCKQNFTNSNENLHKCSNTDLIKQEIIEKANQEDITKNAAIGINNEDHNYVKGKIVACPCVQTSKKLKIRVKTEKNFICSWKDCGKIFKGACSLKAHENKHEGKRSFLCVTCGKGFITRNSLICHEKTHLEVKGYTCKICDIGFSVRSNLRAHQKKHHEGVRFYCSKCTKAFASKCSLDRHERIHTGIKEFQCESCPSAFYTRKELLKHQRYHQGLRSHKCDVCFKSFFERHHLVIHLRTHSGERPYVCKFPNCGKSFVESQKLKRHHNSRHAQT